MATLKSTTSSISKSLGTQRAAKTNDVFSMVSQINEYLSNSKQRIKISINARKNVESNFDKSKVLQQWIKVLNENMKVDN